MIVDAQEEITVSFTLNGRKVSGRCQPRVHLADFLRHHCDMTGTHVGCEHGVCGACTVLVDGRAMRSCLLYAVQAQDLQISTVEGLAQGPHLSKLQEEFRNYFALQCGFCTPGILMSAVDLLQSNSNPCEADVRNMLSGHLCRCTGYDAIVKAILAAPK